jgi:hypothetical protein
MKEMMNEGEGGGGENKNKNMIWNNRWFVLVAAIWLQACAGIGYMFGAISPVMKTSLGYNQKQINRLGVAKDIGDSVGLLAGLLCDVLPTWALLFLGALQNFVGYGWIWLIVTGRTPTLPFALVCVLICVGTNGESYFNTAALVTCVRNFSENRGPVVGILKGFAGLSGAIFTQIFAATFAPDQASVIFMVAVFPTSVALMVMFVLRHVPAFDDGLKNAAATRSLNFRFVYGVCLALAAYLMAAIIIQDMTHVSGSVNVAFACGLLFLLCLPLVIPLWPAAGFCKSFSVSVHNFLIPEPTATTSEKDLESPLQAPLLGHDRMHSIAKGQVNEGVVVPDHCSSINNSSSKQIVSVQNGSHLTAADVRKVHSPIHKDESLFSELEDEKETWPENVRQQRMELATSRLFRAVAEGAVKIKRRKGPRRGEDFTMKQAAVKADFWLLFFGLLCGAGSGLMVLDNLGQISQSLGYANAHIFVSMISIWNFLAASGVDMSQRSLPGIYLSSLWQSDF